MRLLLGLPHRTQTTFLAHSLQPGARWQVAAELLISLQPIRTMSALRECLTRSWAREAQKK
jgi:hypothetical protein